MELIPTSQKFRPKITFQDTNVVGNVYFLTYFRWQAECLDHWLREHRAGLWSEIRAGEQQLQVAHWETRFEDPLGATIGDSVEVLTSICEDAQGMLDASAEVVRQGDSGPHRIASGHMTIATHDGARDLGNGQSYNDHPTGACYSFVTMLAAVATWNPLDLLAWQGKCRELFLADYAHDTLHGVASQTLILQTTRASIDLLQLPPQQADEVEVEMRLESLKCGQLGVRFDYIARAPDGSSVRFAKGGQKMCSKRRTGTATSPCALPTDMLQALRKFTESDTLLNKIDEILSFSTACRRDIATAAAS